jgi:hypothetical protein
VRRLAREFLAVRERRQTRLDSGVVAFETAAELNEGLAQYAMQRGLRELARRDPRRWRAAADAEAAQESALLDSLLAIGPRSVRRRFYATGSTIALLLDRLADATWKEQLVREDATLQQTLAAAARYQGREALGAARERRTEAELAALTRDAERAVAALGERRSAQRDSALARPGLHLVLDPSRLPNSRFDWCGFDPQNVLQTPAGELLHMRMLRACAGRGSVEAAFDQAVVEDRRSGLLRAAVGTADSLTITAAGATIALPADGSSIDVRDLKLEGPTLTLAARRAMLSRSGAELRIVPVP